MTMDLLRGVACLMILSYHLRFDRPIGLGQAAMEIFFVISGYLISRSLNFTMEKNGLPGIPIFAIRRIRRLMPAMAVFLAGAFCLNLSLSEISGLTFAFASFFSVIGGYNFFQVYYSPKVIGLGGIWSLSLEEQFYLTAVLFMVFFHAMGVRSALRLLGLAIALMLCGICFRLSAYLNWYRPGDNGHLPYLPPLRLWGFGLGACVAYMEAQPIVKSAIRKLNQKILIVLFISGVVIISLLIASVKIYTAATFLFQWAAIPLCAAGLVLISPLLDYHSQSWRPPTSRPFALIYNWSGSVISAIRLVGLASYSIYLWHCLVIAGFVRYNLHQQPYAWPLMASLSLSLGILSWELIEKRFYDFRISGKAPTAVTSQ